MGLFTSKPAPAPLGIGFVPQPVPASGVGGFSRTLIVIAGALFLVFLGVAFYNYLANVYGLKEISFKKQEESDDVLPTPQDGKERKVIPANELARAMSGTDYGVQFWMFVSDWDYKFSQVKDVLQRKAGTAGAANPRITLHPTDNALQVQVRVFPIDATAATAAEPTSDSTGDSFTCTVENIPLQRWFSVSMTVFQRNLDIYIDGRLVKSCVLPGVPRPVDGDLILNEGGGFSGSLCNVKTYGQMLSPTDASSFHASGTRCEEPAPAKAKETPPDDSFFIRLFGYTLKFARLNKKGEELSSYTI
jgi:hypothetical protein